MLTLLTHTFLNTGFSLQPPPQPELGIPSAQPFQPLRGLLLPPLLADLTAEVLNLSPP